MIGQICVESFFNRPSQSRTWMVLTWFDQNNVWTLKEIVISEFDSAVSSRSSKVQNTDIIFFAEKTCKSVLENYLHNKNVFFQRAKQILKLHFHLQVHSLHLYHRKVENKQKGGKPECLRSIPTADTINNRVLAVTVAKWVCCSLSIVCSLACTQ